MMEILEKSGVEGYGITTEGLVPTSDERMRVSSKAHQTHLFDIPRQQDLENTKGIL